MSTTKPPRRRGLPRSSAKAVSANLPEILAAVQDLGQSLARAFGAQATLCCLMRGIDPAGMAAAEGYAPVDMKNVVRGPDRWFRAEGDR